MKNILTNKLSRMYRDLNDEYEESSIGYGAIAIIGQGCIGSVAVMLVLMNNNMPRNLQFIQLFLIVILCMGFNGSVLSQRKPKIQVLILILSVIVSVLIIGINIF